MIDNLARMTNFHVAEQQNVSSNQYSQLKTHYDEKYKAGWYFIPGHCVEFQRRNIEIVIIEPGAKHIKSETAAIIYRVGCGVELTNGALGKS